MHSGQSLICWDFNIMDIPICVICFEIQSNPKIGRSTRMHCIYLDNIYSYELDIISWNVY